MDRGAGKAMSAICVTHQGAVVRRSGGRYVVEADREPLMSVPQAAVDSMGLFGGVQITTQAMQQLLADGVPVLIYSRGGKFLGVLQPGFPKNPATRIAQYDASLDPSFSLAVARTIVRTKIERQLLNLRHWGESGWLRAEDASPGIRAARDLLDEQASIAGLMGLEARAARLYFEMLGRSLPPGCEWNGRNRQPPLDPPNALLSFTYMLALGEVVVACHGAGMDPSIGFLHQLDYARPSLALDVLEPLRPSFCDTFVLRLLQMETVSPDQFSMGTEGCRLLPAARTVVLQEWGTLIGKNGRRQGLKSAATILLRTLADSLRTRQPPTWADSDG